MKREEAIEIYKGERERFEKSRGIQWKFDIAIWTLVALGIDYLDSNIINSNRCVSLILAIFFVIWHFVFAYLIQKGLIASRTRTDKIIESLNSNAETINIDLRRQSVLMGGNDLLWILFQGCATAILVTFLFLKAFQ